MNARPTSKPTWSKASEELLARMSISTSNKENPLPSKQFRIHHIMNSLTVHFKQCWEHEKSISPKLSFYHLCKTKFGKETYLDTSKGFSRRYSTTKFRISAHDLEIETGRYKNVPRNERFCHWCRTCMDKNVVEDENHVLFTCNLYANIRSKLINTLNKSPFIPQIENYTQLTISSNTLERNLMKLLSPHTKSEPITMNTSNQFNQHHLNFNLRPNTPLYDSLLQTRSHVINSVCTFFYRCIEKRWKYLKELRGVREAELPSTILITLIRSR